MRTARQAVPLPYLGKAGGQERDRQDRVGRECGDNLHSVSTLGRIERALAWSGGSKALA